MRPGACHKDGVPRMLRSAPRLRRGALLIRGPQIEVVPAAWVPALRSATSCRSASGTRERTLARAVADQPSGRFGAGLEYIERIDAARLIVARHEDRISSAEDRADDHQIVRKMKALDAEVR